MYYVSGDFAWGPRGEKKLFGNIFCSHKKPSEMGLT
jgi:hypothetical protein